MVADDGLIRLRRLELVAGFVSIEEEVADELLGALIEGMEVLRNVLGFIVPARIKNRLSLIKTDAVGCERYITHGDNEELEDDWRGLRQRACCPPLLEVEKDWGFWAKKDEEGRECCS